MTQHEVKILGYIEGSKATSNGFMRDTTISFLEVKPRITVGEKMAEVVLGRLHYAVSLAEVSGTAESTTLFACSETPGLDMSARHAQIDRIAERIRQHLDVPSTACEMYQDNPFPQFPQTSA